VIRMTGSLEIVHVNGYNYDFVRFLHEDRPHLLGCVVLPIPNRIEDEVHTALPPATLRRPPRSISNCLHHFPIAGAPKLQLMECVKG
jgi:hypothetical protein